jgi:two-component system phosphate regulon sensor histidine kinase PhoR
MLKKRIPLITFCFFCMACLLGMQVYWIKGIYGATKANFEKEASLSFELAVKKEFDQRCDRIERLVSQKLMDTSTFTIIAHKGKDGYFYSIANSRNPKDVSNGISMSNIRIPIIAGDTANRRKITDGIAKTIRATDLENHTLYYRTQELGSYIAKLIRENDFSEQQLKTFYSDELSSRNIKIPYRLLYGQRARVGKQEVATKTYPNYSQKKPGTVIGAVFSDPFPYVAANMAVGFGCAVILVLLIAFCVGYLVKSLLKEKRLAEIKNDFISNITHEFKTPLATISAAVEALESFDGILDQKKAKRYLHHARAETGRLSGLVDQVLNIALYQKQQPVLAKEPIQLVEIFKELINIHTFTSSKVINFFYDPANLNHTLRANKMQFEHAISNIIDNAIKYAVDPVDITIETTLKGGFLLVAIKDNGIGISADELGFIFEQFYRSPAVIYESQKGYGLGLNYVKKIVEQHSGWYKVESKLGKGSTFILAWPI